MTLALRPGPRLAWATVAGLAVRATLLRPGRPQLRDPSGFPPAEVPPAAANAALRVVALPGPVAPLALVRWPATRGGEAQLVAADLAGGGTRAAVALVAAVVATARRAGAARLRCDAAALDRATALLAFRRD